MNTVMPAIHLQAMLPDLLSTFLPEGLRGRFDAAADSFALLGPEEWDARWLPRRADMQRLIDELTQWLDLPDWELLLSAKHPDLQFFYILRVQAAALLVARLAPDQWVPGNLERTWHWMMDVREGEPWGMWTVAVRGWEQHLKSYPPIWRIVWPKGL